MIHPWTFPGHFVRAVDGDTVLVTLDLGFSLLMTQRLRLANINAPEMSGATKEAGLAARTAATAWWAHLVPGKDGYEVEVETKRTDDYGRYIAIVRPSGGGESLNDFLVRTGNAVPFDVGRGGV